MSLLVNRRILLQISAVGIMFILQTAMSTAFAEQKPIRKSTQHQTGWFGRGGFNLCA